MILKAVRLVPSTIWVRVQLLSLVGFMVPALLLFALAGTALPWNHWILLLAPLPVLAFGAGIDRESSKPQSSNAARLGAALMLVWVLAGFISLSADSRVPSIVWFLWAVAALASVCAVLSRVELLPIENGPCELQLSAPPTRGGAG